MDTPAGILWFQIAPASLNIFHLHCVIRIAYSECNLMVPFIRLKEESNVDPKIAKRLFDSRFPIDLCMAFCATDDPVITDILYTYVRVVFRRGSNHFIFLSMIDRNFCNRLHEYVKILHLVKSIVQLEF